MASSRPQTIALLGATGNTGQVVLRSLLAGQEHSLKIYARSKDKLLNMFPALADDENVHLYIGSIDDKKLICDLLTGADTIISTVGSDGFAPTTINREAAQAVISSLESLKRSSKTDAWNAPRLLWLSSTTKNRRFAAARPRLVQLLIETAFAVGYEDLQAAQDIVLARPDLCSVLLVQPGVLVDEAATGCEISVESVRIAASYEDLGHAFVELATSASYSSLREVAVSSKGGDRAGRYAPYILTRIFRGLLTAYVPFGVRIDRIFGRWLPWYTM